MSHACSRRRAVSLLHLLLAVVLVAGLTGCGKDNPNEWTVNRWVDDADPCTSATARAIAASGRPWPNEKLDAKGRLAQFDMWIGSQLFELSAAVPLAASGFLPRAHPLRYMVVSGNAEEFLGVAVDRRHGTKESPGVPATLFGLLQCRTGDRRSAWIEQREITAPTRQQAVQLAVTRARAYDPQRLVRVEVHERADLRMTEVRTYTNPVEISLASYFPWDVELAQEVNGQRLVKAIVCRPHDTAARMSVADVCRAWIWLAPGAWIEFSVYQQMLPLMPAMHAKLLAVFEGSRRK